MKKCPFCAEEIQDGAIKCRFCGEFLTESQTNQQMSSKKRNEKTLNPILAGAVIIWSAIIIPIVLYHRIDPDIGVFMGLIYSIIGVSLIYNLETHGLGKKQLKGFWGMSPNIWAVALGLGALIPLWWIWGLLVIGYFVSRAKLKEY